MSTTTIYSHGDDTSRVEAPTIEIVVWPAYVVVKFKRSDFETAYFVHQEGDESMDALVGRVTRSLVPVVDFSSAAKS